MNGSLCRRIVAGTLPALLMLATLATAGSDDARERLRRLRREAAALTQENMRLGEQEKNILGRLDELAARRDVAAAELEVARTALDQVSSAADSWGEEEARALLGEQSARRELATRLRQMERLGPTARLAALAAAPSPGMAIAGLRAFTDAAALNRRMVTAARRSRQRAVTAAREVRAARLGLQAAMAQARAGEESAATATREYQERLEKIRGEARLFSQAATELNGASARLQAFLAGDLSAPPDGPDPLRLRGTLPWPARGEVLQGFGPRRHARFGTLVPHNGIAIAAPAGADVRAIVDGKVIFADWFQGYGRTVILDHGAGFMTVQSHLSAVIVSVGQDIRQGQLLGLVGDSGSLEGVRLYFEIRREGTPEDPEGWLGHSPGI